MIEKSNGRSPTHGRYNLLFELHPRRLSPLNVKTAGFDVIRGREISVMGAVIVAVVLLLLGIVWGTSRVLDRRAKTAETLEIKVVEWYIATGEVNSKLQCIRCGVKNTQRHVIGGIGIYMAFCVLRV